MYYFSMSKTKCNYMVCIVSSFFLSINTRNTLLRTIFYSKDYLIFNYYVQNYQKQTVEKQ